MAVGVIMNEDIEQTDLADADHSIHSNGALLEVKDLRVWFELRRWGFGHAGSVRAVDDINFTLDYGEAIAVVGESGCGKSSLMKTILGLNRPTGGEILFDDEKVSDLQGNALQSYRSHVGYVQQDPFGALPPFMNVERILEEPLIINGIRDEEKRLERIRKVMEEVKLSPVDDFLNKYPHMLSGGQQQRVVIARAMILEPKMIVADEPVSMLDASVRVEILKLLRGLQEFAQSGSNLHHARFVHGSLLFRTDLRHVCRKGHRKSTRQTDAAHAAAPLHPGPARGDLGSGR